MRRIRTRLTYANVIATLALFVALGGTAAASVIISDNSEVAKDTISGHAPPAGDHANIISGSVTTGDLELGAVTAGRLAASSVGSAKIVDGGVGNADLAAGAVDSSKVVDGSLTGADVQNRGLSDSDIGTPAQVAGANIPSVPANGCLPLQLNFGSWTQVGELVFAQARDGQFGQSGLFFTPLVVTTTGNAFGRVCNVTNAALDPPAEDILAWSLRQ